MTNDQRHEIEDACIAYAAAKARFLSAETPQMRDLAAVAARETWSQFMRALDDVEDSK